uniref:Uncharacterized protein n=1 Tax=Arundo donax TaxID=35708 RepID=A0A0A9E5T8_ARUDO
MIPASPMPRPLPSALTASPLALVQAITERLREVYVPWCPETWEEHNHLADSCRPSLAYTGITPF